MTIGAVSLVLPAYNEAGAVGGVIAEYAQALRETGIEHEIIVVDDGSNDSTREEARKAGATVIGPPSNMGYGQSLRRGIRAAKYEWILISDADGTYPASAAKKILELAEHYDMVVGARTGRHYRGGWLRRPARSLLGSLARFVTGSWIPDVNSGLRIFRKEVVEQYFDILSSGFSFTTGLTLAMMNDGLGVHFVETEYRARVGKSKVRPFRDTLRMTQVLVQAAVRHNPIKLFTLLTLFLWATAAALIAVWAVSREAILLGAGIAAFLLSVHLFGQGLVAEAARGRRRY